MGCAALQHVGPSQIRDQTRVHPALTGRFLSTAPPEKSQCVPMCCLSHVRLRDTPSTVARQAPLSMELSRQEYCSGLPCPPPGHLPDPGIKPAYPVFPALVGTFLTTSATWEALESP